MIVTSAQARPESCGSHYRRDYPEAEASRQLANVYVQRHGDQMRLWHEPVVFSRRLPSGHAVLTHEQTYLAQEGE